jgi:hypothetical protein
MYVCMYVYVYDSFVDHLIEASGTSIRPSMPCMCTDGASAVWLTAASFITPSSTLATQTTTTTPSLTTPAPPTASLHDNSSNNDNDNDAKIWSGADCTRVYRPVGDLELMYLVNNNALPSTQPYQAIIEGDAGRTYAEKYLLVLIQSSYIINMMPRPSPQTSPSPSPSTFPFLSSNTGK